MTRTIFACQVIEKPSNRAAIAPAMDISAVENVIACRRLAMGNRFFPHMSMKACHSRVDEIPCGSWANSGQPISCRDVHLPTGEVVKQHKRVEVVKMSPSPHSFSGFALVLRLRTQVPHKSRPGSRVSTFTAKVRWLL